MPENGIARTQSAFRHCMSPTITPPRAGRTRQSAGRSDLNLMRRNTGRQSNSKAACACVPRITCNPQTPCPKAFAPPTPAKKDTYAVDLQESQSDTYNGLDTRPQGLQLLKIDPRQKNAKQRATAPTTLAPRRLRIPAQSRPDDRQNTSTRISFKN